MIDSEYIMSVLRDFSEAPEGQDIQDWGVDSVDTTERTFRVWVEYYDGSSTAYMQQYELTADGSISDLFEPETDENDTYWEDNYPDEDDSVYSEQDFLVFDPEDY